MIFVGLPAFNEAENIGPLLEELAHVSREALAGKDLTVLVVDDGSSDGTAARVERFAAALDRSLHPRLAIELVRHDGNRGLAAALATIFEWCARRGRARDVLVTMDADDSHLPGLIDRMVGVLAEGHDVVIGSRFQHQARVLGVSAWRRLMSVGASWLFRAVFPIPHVRDYTCGYRAYRLPVIQRALARDPQFVSERGFTCMVDVLLKLHLTDAPCLMVEVPMVLRYDRKRGASKMDVRSTVVATLGLMLRRRLGR